MSSVSVYESKPGRWVVSENDVWLPGVFDSPETARRAADFPREALHELRRIYHVDGENRPVTMADLPS
jgi:hypothetical protein